MAERFSPKVGSILLATTLAVSGAIESLNMRLETHGFVTDKAASVSVYAGVNIGDQYPNLVAFNGQLDAYYNDKNVGLETITTRAFPGMEDIYVQCQYLADNSQEDNSQCK